MLPSESMHTRVRLQKLERKVEALWQLVEDERLWHPTVIRELQRRSQSARRAHAGGRLRTAAEVFASLRRR